MEQTAFLSLAAFRKRENRRSVTVLVMVFVALAEILNITLLTQVATSYWTVPRPMVQNVVHGLRQSELRHTAAKP